MLKDVTILTIHVFSYIIGTKIHRRFCCQTAGAQIAESLHFQRIETSRSVAILHTQEVTGSSPAVSTKKFLISSEIRNFFAYMS